MTPEQLEQQSREAVIAYLQDSSVRIEACGKSNMDWHLLKDSKGIFNLLDCYYRIAQPKPWYRVALVDGVCVTVVDNKIAELHLSKQISFTKWLTDRIEYTL